MKKFLIGIIAILLIQPSFAQSTDGMSIVFEENFRNNKNGWFTSMNGTNRSKVDNSAENLVIGVNEKGSMERSWVVTEIDFNQDFVLKTSLKSSLDKKGKDDVRYGLLVGLSDLKYRDEQGWYGFRLYSNEKKAWMYATNGNGTKLFEREMESPSAYNSGDYNELAIEKKGDTVNYYLNGKMIYSNDATESSAGSIYFEAKGEQKAFMNSLVVYQ